MHGEHANPQDVEQVQASQGWNQPRTGEAPPAPARSARLSTGAVAGLLVGALLAGTAGGYVGSQLGAGRADTSTVNEVLRQPISQESAPVVDGSIETVAAKVLPAVVAIQVASERAVASGSGSVISPDGYVLTNHHVVAGARGGQIQVTMNDGSKHPADLVASDANTDVGVIKIRDVENLPYLDFADSSALRVGQGVVAVGSPLGLNATVTSGIVSALNRPVRASQGGGESSLIDAIQTDAAVNPGNSGGPLVDMEGNLVGMNSMIASLSATGGQESGSIGLGFAIPSTFAKRMADQLINTGQVKHPMLGVQVSPREMVDGALIRAVEPGSPADAAGLREGDIITRVDERQIDSADSLIAATRSQEFGATVTLEVVREDNSQPRQVEVTLTSE
ncbi:S1C family serine protease [Corynebacterium lizhenjunii]|uniref:S1C family serine protease n=1 Tax=Corynebacterium lizhenjunii TaxID=2709394 RepID=UPI0013EA69E6|nr:trypsin-like peptidase domain-containing protein [Corynebacterium lizhenjunii]